MTWDDLKVFLEVARQRSHAGATRVLRVDATTVGRRVLALERSLSSRLFDRTPEGLAPTQAGALLLSHAERIETEVLALQRELAGADARHSGSVQLTASDGVVNYVIVPRLVELQRAYPGLELSVRAEARVLDLSRREADIAVRLVRPTESTLVGRRLGRMGFTFYAGQSYIARVATPRNLAGLAGHAFIGFDRDLEHVPTFRWLRKQVPELRLSLRANTTAAQVRACVAGFGIALLPRFIAPFEPGLVELFPRIETPTREVWAVSHRDLRRNPRVSLVIEWLTQILAMTVRALIRRSTGIAAVGCGPHGHCTSALFCKLSASVRAVIPARRFTWLILALACLVACAAAAPFVFTAGTGPQRHTSIRGVEVTTHGFGPYRHMPADIAVQGLAQDVVTLAVGLPFLLWALTWARRGARAGHLALSGALVYLFVQYTLYLAMATYNELFLLWVAIVLLSSQALFRLVLAVPPSAFASASIRAGSRRYVGGFLIVNGALITLLWLQVIVPPLLDGRLYPDGLNHLTTMIVQGFDLALFLPPSLIGGYAYLKRRPLGDLLAPIYAVFVSLQMIALLAKIIWMSRIGANAGPALVVIPTLLVGALVAAWLALRPHRGMTLT